MSMKKEIYTELTTHIIPFWRSLHDNRNGGFYGHVDSGLKVWREAEKGSILHSRILWFFSVAYQQLKETELLQEARHAYEYLVRFCMDAELGGVYWSVSAEGRPQDTTKHTYAQAFAIYGLSAYYQASGDLDALQLAYRHFELIESKCRDEDGYGEAFNRQWRAEGNDKLSENGVKADRTMNTLLHVFEGYSELYQADHNEKVAAAMRQILNRFCVSVYNPRKHRQEVFFDRNYHSLIDLHSYGHDIETAWLLEWGCGLLGDETLSKQVGAVAEDLIVNVLQTAFHNNAMYNECENGKEDTTCVWWVQAEAINGLIHMWQKTNDKTYLNAAKDIWNFIQENLIDRRPHGEWFWAVGANGKPVMEKPVAGIWKCPYHNGRMCIEMLRGLPENV